MKKVFVFILIFLLENAISYSQDLEKMKKEADEQFSFENYHLALPLYLSLLAYDSTDLELYYKAGVCMYHVSRDKLKAIKYFEKASKDVDDAYFYLGILYRRSGDLNNSEKAFLKYKNSLRPKKFSYQEVEYQLERTHVARKLMKEGKRTRLILLDKNVNSEYPDYAPFILPVEGTLFFTSRRPGSSEGNKDPLGLYYEDIYYCKYENKEYLPAKNIGYPINTKYHDACIGFSKDGKTMFIYRNESYTGGDIYTSEKIDEKMWSVPIKFSERLNREGSVESSMTITQDGRTIYFSSDMAGGYGGRDIYRIVKLPNGEWSKPQNLGTVINTPYDEDAPFVSSDGEKLYFSSKGHENMGGYDIFVVQKFDDNTWSEPQNLGVPINSVADDIFFVTNTEGTKGFFSSNRQGGYGDMDIYSVKMSDLAFKPIVLKGSVTTYEPEYKTVKAVITVIDYQTKEIQGVYRTTSDGKFILALLPNKKYKLICESKGYHSTIEEIDLTKKIRAKDLSKNIVLRLK